MGELLDAILDSEPGLREYYELVQQVPDVKCVDCPLYTAKKKGKDGWCKVPYDKHRASIIKPDEPRGCLSHAKYVLKMPV